MVLHISPARFDNEPHSRYAGEHTLTDLILLGGIAALSTMAVPGLLAANVPAQVLARQWEAIFNLGKRLMPGTALVTLACYGYLAYDRSSRGLEWRTSVAAGVATVAIVPFTIIFMRPTNNSLLSIAGGTAASSSSYQDVTNLVLRWRGLNLLRALLPLGGSVLGVWGLLW